MKGSCLLNIGDRDFRCLLKAYNKHGPSGLIAKKEARKAISDYQKNIYTISKKQSLKKLFVFLLISRYW
ncbi:MAG: hypothetical protein K1000chlam1_00793 [Candidatus Anoxychlamydiales bacterium]|nr:hypothetical protein [Candidatus Anoxychlamydiales bacterium]